LAICSIAECSEWLETVARWHHVEWMREREGETPQSEAEHYEKRLVTLRRHLDRSPIPSTFVGIVNGEPVGSASVVYYQFTAQQEKTEWLTNIFVTPAYRNQGIGGQLIEYACQFAARNGVSRLRLYTRDKAEFYQNRGWTKMGSSHVQGDAVELLSRTIALQNNY